MLPCKNISTKILCSTTDFNVDIKNKYLNDFWKDHMVLKTGEMPPEDSASPSQESITF